MLSWSILSLSPSVILVWLFLKVNITPRQWELPYWPEREKKGRRWCPKEASPNPGCSPQWVNARGLEEASSSTGRSELSQSAVPQSKQQPGSDLQAAK